MKITQIIFTLILGLLAIAPLSADELTSEKKQLIDELLVLTGATNPGRMFSEALVQQMTYLLKKSRPDFEPRVFDILQEEVNTVIDEDVGDGNELSYPIYHKYLTAEDVADLVQFYKTPLGQKTIEVMPMISQDAVMAGQQLGRSLGPVIQQRVLERFDAEGIILQQ